MEAGLSLGSNVADRLANLSRAGRMILDIPGISLAARAPVYETEPVDVPAEFARHLFLNSVLIVKTSMPVEQMIQALRSIECSMGRSDAPRNAPRIIDIDVIYAGRIQINTESITIPHRLWFARRFVLQPLCDVRPDLHIPGQTGAVSEVFNRLEDKSKVEYFTNNW